MKIMPLSLIAILVSGLFLFTAVQYQSVTPVLAAAGEGTATVGGGANQNVEISTSNVHTIVLTVGATGIAVDADHPTFTIPAGFTAPHAAGGASVPTQVSEVDVDGEWFIAGAGVACAVTMSSSSATGQVISADVTGACVNLETITLTYKGTAPSTANAAAPIVITTGDINGNGSAAIGSPPTLTVYGTSVFANHAVAAVTTTNNLVGTDLVGGTDLVLGGFSIAAAGENVSFTSIRVVVTPTTMAIGELSNLRIVEDDGTGGVANDGVLDAGELAAPLATVASPVSGNNDIAVVDTVNSGTTDNYFIVGTLAATVSHGDTLDVDADGTATASGVTSSVSITSTGASTNSTRTVTDTTPPTVVNTYSVDTDADGNVDALDVEFSEAILDASVAVAQLELDNDATNNATGEQVATGGSTTVVYPGADATANDKYYRLTLTDGAEIAGTEAVYLHITGTSLTDANGVAIVAADNVGTPNDRAAPVFSATAPTTSAYINTQKVSYTVSEALTGGAITWTKAGGVPADAGSPHTCALQGTALTSGTHTDLVMATDANACVNWASALVDGVIYTVSFDGGDGIQNATQVSNTGVTYDTTAPTVTIDAPAVINNANKTAYTLTGDCSENTRTVSVSIGGVLATPTCTALAWTTGAIDVSAALDNVALPITADHTDAAGNNATQATTTVLKDTVAPSGYTISIDQGAYINNSQKNNVSFTFTGAEVGTTYYYSIDDNAPGTPAITGSGAVVSANQTVGGLSVVGLFDVTLTFTVYLVDPAGNQGADATDTAIKDTILPLISENTPVPSRTNDTTPDVTITSNEAGGVTVGGSCGTQTAGAINGNTVVTLDADGAGTPLIEGTYADCTVRVTDAAGNAALPITLTAFTIDTTAPSVSGTTLSHVAIGAGLVGSDTFYIDVTYNENMDPASTPTAVFTPNIVTSGTLTLSATSNWTAGNTYRIYYNVADVNEVQTITNLAITLATDAAGNTQNAFSGSPTLSVDTVAPVLAEVTPVPTPGNNQNPAYTFSSTKTGTITFGGTCDSATTAAVVGSNTITLDSNGAGAPLGEGAHGACTVTVTDTLGNVSLALSITSFTIDITPPSIASVFAVQQNGTAATATTNVWYFYSGDNLRFRVTSNEALSDLKACVRSITGDDSSLTCTTQFAAGTLNTDFIQTTTNVGGFTYEFSTPLATLAGGGTVTDPDGYPMNLAITDAVGNVTYSSGAADSFVAALNVDPKVIYTGTPSINNATTTDWSTITDYSNANVVFNANDGVNDVGSIAFTGLDLTSQTTVDQLAALASYMVVKGDQGTGAIDISIDHTNLSIFDTGATITIRVPSAVRPGLVVRNTAGTIVGSVPNDEAGTPTVDGDTLGGFTWNAGTQTLSFTTTGFSSFGADSTAPTVSSYSPADESTTAAISSDLVLTFGENVVVGTGNVVIYKVSDDSVVETIDITSGQVTFNGTTGVTINPTANFANSTAYYVKVDATAIEDSVGNAYAGIANNTTWNFTTVAAVVPPAPTPTPSGGGGGGGGGQGPSTNPDSNTTTTTAVATITTLEGDQSYSSPVQFDEEDITVDEENGTASVQLTNEGSLTIKPNSKSTISAYFPPNTTVTGPADWDGRIDPPVLRSLTMILSSGEKIEGSSEKLMREDVAAIVKVGATVPLQFSQEVTLTIPVDLPDGSVVLLYTSQDGNIWKASGEGVVQNGLLIIKTDHFSYFAIRMTDETRIAAEMMTEEEGFTDIIGHWAESYINQIRDLGIVSGKTDTTYAPNDFITRAELAKIATKAFGVEIDPSPSLSPFSDVPLSAWFAPYIVAARNAGIVQGYENNVFSPNGLVNRAEALKIMLEAKGFTDIESHFTNRYGDHADYTYASFPDVGIDVWFAKYVTYASDKGVVSGYQDGTFGPGNSITRAEVAKIIVNVMGMPEATAEEGEGETPAE